MFTKFQFVTSRLFVLFFLAISAHASHAAVIILSDPEHQQQSFDFSVNAHALSFANGTFFVGAAQAVAKNNFAVAMALRDIRIFQPLTPEIVTLNGEDKKVNPLHGAGIGHMALLNLFPVVTKLEEQARIYLIEQNGFVVQQSTLLRDAAGIVAPSVLALTTTAPQVYTALEPNSTLAAVAAVSNQQGNFDGNGAGISLIYLRKIKKQIEKVVEIPSAQNSQAQKPQGAKSQEIFSPQDRGEIAKKKQKKVTVTIDMSVWDAVDAQTGAFQYTEKGELTDKGNKAFPITIETAQLKIGSALSHIGNVVDLYFDRALGRLYIALDVQAGSNSLDGARAVVVGTLSNNTLSLTPIAPDSAFNVNDKIIGGIGALSQTRVFKVRTLQTTTHLRYLLVQGGNDNGILNLRREVSALPLVDNLQSDAHGTLADVNSNPVTLFAAGSPFCFQARVFNAPAQSPNELYSMTSTAARVGGTAHLPGDITDMQITGDTVFVSVRSDEETTSALMPGIFYSQALFDSQGRISHWTDWQRALGMADSISGFSYDPFLGKFLYIPFLKNDGNVVTNTVLRTAWSKVSLTDNKTLKENAQCAVPCVTFSDSNCKFNSKKCNKTDCDVDCNRSSCNKGDCNNRNCSRHCNKRDCDKKDCSDRCNNKRNNKHHKQDDKLSAEKRAELWKNLSDIGPFDAFTAFVSKQFSQKHGGVQALIDFPFTTSSFSQVNGKKLSMQLYLGFNKVMLVQTGQDSSGIFGPVQNFSHPFISENGSLQGFFETGTLVVSGGQLNAIAPLTSAAIVSDERNAWLVVGGAKGIAVLADESGRGWDVQEGLQSRFHGFKSTFSFQVISNVSTVRKLVANKNSSDNSVVRNTFFALTNSSIQKFTVTEEAISALNRPGTLIPTDEQAKTKQVATNVHVTEGLKPSIIAAIDDLQTNSALKTCDNADVSTFSDLIVTGPLGILATSFGLFRSANGIDIRSHHGIVRWETIPLAESVGSFTVQNPITRLFAVSKTGREEDVGQQGNLYVLNGYVGLNQALVYRFVVNVEHEQVTNMTIQSFPDYFVRGIQTFYVNLGAYRNYFVTDGALTEVSRSAFGTLEPVSELLSPTLKSGDRLGNRVRALFTPLSHLDTSIGEMVRSSSSGAWYVPGDFGIKILA